MAAIDRPVTTDELLQRLLAEQRQNAKSAQLALVAACSGVELAIAALADGLPADARSQAVESLKEQIEALSKMKRLCDAWVTQAEQLAAGALQRTRKES